MYSVILNLFQDLNIKSFLRVKKMKRILHHIMSRGGVFVCIAVLLLTSCENFLKATQVKEEIEEAIEIANSSPILYHIIADKDSGTVSPSQATLKKKQSVNLLFTPADGWSFICWEALDRNTNEPVPDAIQFENPQKLETKAVIIKPAENLMIHPKCQLVPKVIEITPKFDNSGCDQDRTIEIIFNKAVDPQTLDFASISITTPEGAELFSTDPTKSFFETPYFSNDNKVLNIPTIKGKFLLLPDNIDENTAVYNSKKSTDDITVRLDLSAVKDTDGLTFEQTDPHTYRVNKTVDNVPPVITSINLFSTSDESDYFYKELTQKSYDTWSESISIKRPNNLYMYKKGDFSRNHVSHLYMNIYGYDDSSEIGTIRVKETYKRSTSDIEITSQITTSRDFGENDFIVEDIDDDDFDYKNYKLEYDFDSRNTNDGLYLIEVSILDKANNESSSETYWVIKDSVADPKCNISEATNPNNKEKNKIRISTYNSTNDTYVSDLEVGGTSSMSSKYWIIINNSDSFYKGWTSNRIVTVSLEEEDSEDVLIYENYSADSSDASFGDKISQALENKDIHFNSYKTTAIRIRIEEESGIVKEKTITLLKSVDVLGFSPTGAICNSSETFYEGEEITYQIVYTYQSDENSTPGNYTLLTSNTLQTFTTNGIYNVYIIRKCGLFYSALGKPMKYYKGVSNSSTFPDIVFPQIKKLPVYADKDIVYERNSEKAKFNLELIYSENTSTNYSYSIYLRDTYYTTRGYYFNSVNNKPNLFEIEVPSGEEYQIYLFAIDADGKVVKQSDPIPESPACLSLKDEDNTPPVIASSFPVWNATNSWEYYIESNAFRSIGLIKGYAKDSTTDYLPEFYYYYVPADFNGNLEEVSSKYQRRKVAVTSDDITNNYVNIPFDDLNYGNYRFYTLAYDKSGNFSFQKASGTVTYYTAATAPELNAQSNKIKISSSPLTNDICQGFMVNITNYERYLNILTLQNNRWVESKIHEKPTEEVPEPEQTASKLWNYELDYPAADSFIKVCGLYCTYYSNSSGSWSPNIPITMKPVYAYTGYYKYLAAGGTANDYCKSKTWMPMANGWQIFNDKPCFVHTRYCSKNLTEPGNLSKDAAYEWEARAQETGIVYNDGTTMTFSYTNDNLDGIPSGYYYTTICHFADGTVVMSEVKQKE